MSCVFCKIIEKELPADILLENENAVVFRDLRPKAPMHYLVIPRKHIASLNDIKEEDKKLLADLILTAREVAEKLGIKESGYKLAIHVGQGGGQEVFHLHIHVLGGWN